MYKITNEFGEEIGEDKIKELAKRIYNLSDEKVDELWFRCGFIISGHEEAGLKALRKEDIENIRKGDKDLEETVKWFLHETPIKLVEEKLSELEK